MKSSGLYTQNLISNRKNLNLSFFQIGVLFDNNNTIKKIDSINLNLRIQLTN